jgi:hypothetical protein
LEETVTQTPALNENIYSHVGGFIEYDFYRTHAIALRNQIIRDVATATIQRISKHLRALGKEFRRIAHDGPARKFSLSKPRSMSNSEIDGN